MDDNVYYFYRKKLVPISYEIYFHGMGIIGYSNKIKGKKYFFKGTEKELIEYYKNRKVPRVMHSKNTLVGY